MKVRTRFAPSPTGALHAGTVRTALFAWLAARHSGGDFILRIEDTDRVREVEGATKNIIESLNYLGLDWDEGPDKNGGSGPYIQSDRLDIYKEWGQKLIDKGRAYADPLSPEELEKLRSKAKAENRPFLYRDYRPTNPSKWDGSQPLRFKSEPKAYKWTDEVMGSISTGPEVVDDFILIKSDGFPTYNFAHIIDDYLMGVNLVVRSQEFISSMPIFLNLYEALGFELPAFATVPNVLEAGGNRKLSKRYGAKQLLDYRDMGVLPEALMNCLATTGWNDGSTQEVFSREELIKKFDLSRVQKSAARFDEKRLEWLNGQHIRRLDISQLDKRVADIWPAQAHSHTKEYKDKVLALIQDRLRYLSELPELSMFFFSEPSAKQVSELFEKPMDKQLVNVPPAELHQLLTETKHQLEQSDFSRDDIAGRLNGLLEKLSTKPGILFAAIRIAVTGSTTSPELFGTLAVLGKEKSLARIDIALSFLVK